MKEVGIQPADCAGLYGQVVLSSFAPNASMEVLVLSGVLLGSYEAVQNYARYSRPLWVSGATDERIVV